MPDIKTALQKVITEWEKPADPPAAPTPAAHRFQPTNNISRTTFEFIKANPGLTRAEVVAKLTAKGYKATSTSSLVTQMIRQGLVKVGPHNRVFTDHPEYTPIKPRLVRAAQKAAAKPRKQAAKKPVEPTPAETVTRPVRQTAVEELLEQLSIVQARELYDQLRKIFGTKD